MKILSREQTQQADAYTIAREPIASIDLMERASEKFVEALIGSLHKSEKIAIVCGTGNNGGDGLAISRVLSQKGYLVHPIIIQPSEGGSPDFLKNLSRLDNIEAITIKSANDTPPLDSYQIIIDAIFGSGLTRPVTGLFSEVINSINQSGTKVIAIDLPSGLYMDDPAPDGAIIQALKTISFQLPKLAFMFPENHQFVGDWQVVDIGLDKNFIADQSSNYETIDLENLFELTSNRSKFAHKGSFGHGQLIVGSYGKMGAATLSAQAFLRSGGGLLTTTIPKAGVTIMQTTVPEAMVLDQPGENFLTKFNFLEGATAVGIGPGIGQEKQTLEAFAYFLEKSSKPLIIDADGINILSNNRHLIELLPKDTILTPHLKEFDRLAGNSLNNWQRLEKAKELCAKLQIIIVLKGAHTAVINTDGNVAFNTTGNPGMATAGSGDVLLGIITSLRAQGIAAYAAAKAGVLIHGIAGDRAAEKMSMTGMIASDIVQELSAVFLEHLK